MKVEYLQGAPPLVESFTHTKLHMQVLGTIHGSGHICPLQSSLLVVLYTRCCGVGSIFLPWGKGLKFIWNHWAINNWWKFTEFRVSLLGNIIKCNVYELYRCTLQFIFAYEGIAKTIHQYELSLNSFFRAPYSNRFIWKNLFDFVRNFAEIFAKFVLTFGM